jgi:hypothetical protein
LVTTVFDGTQTKTMKNALRVVQARNQRRGGSSMSDAAVTEAGASYLGLLRAAEGLRHRQAMTLLVGAHARVRATCTKVKAIAAQRLPEV